MIADDQAQLRAAGRAARRAMPDPAAAAQAAAERLLKLPEFAPTQTSADQRRSDQDPAVQVAAGHGRPHPDPPRVVAGSFAVDGEIDPAPALARLRGRGWTVVYPVPDGDDLRFLRHDPAETPTTGRFGIPEPRGEEIATSAIDVFIVPVTAVDDAGNRVGMGGGFYDRVFARSQRMPDLIVALAYDQQVVEAVPAQPWDLAVDRIVTPTRTLWTSGATRR